MSVCLSGPAAWAPTTIPVGGNAVEAKSLFDRVRRVENGIHDQLSRKRVCICRWPTPSVVRDLGVCHRKEIESIEKSLAERKVGPQSSSSASARWAAKMRAVIEWLSVVTRSYASISG